MLGVFWQAEVWQKSLGMAMVLPAPYPSPEAVSKALNIINHEHKLLGAC